MPLDKSCSKDAISRNISRLIKKEKKPRKQAIAIALSVYRRACGMEPYKGKSQEEEAFGLAGPPHLYSPNRIPPRRLDDPQRPRHSKNRSGREKRKAVVFTDPDTFVSRFVPVERFFEGFGSASVRGVDLVGIRSQPHGLGVSDASSTTQEPHRRKKGVKFKVPPTKGETAPAKRRSTKGKK